MKFLAAHGFSWYRYFGGLSGFAFGEFVLFDGTLRGYLPYVLGWTLGHVLIVLFSWANAVRKERRRKRIFEEVSARYVTFEQVEEEEDDLP